MKQSEIKITITLDNEQVPETLEWEATDSGMEGRRPCKATMLTLWDEKENTTMRIDLWSKDMLVDDMKRFFYENFMTMADTYRKATNEEELSKEIRKFAEWFGQKSGVITPKPS
jgi:gliding motility-associated protein GldC